MANPNYVRSTDGANADNGSTWALANLDIAGIAADCAAGDRTWISDNHAESTAASITMTSPGTLTTPNQILCGDDAAEPPTALANTATVTTTGSGYINLNGSYYMNGVNFYAGTGYNASNIVFFADATTDQQTYENCAFNIVGTDPGARISVGAYSGTDQGIVTWKNCTCSFAATGSHIRTMQADLVWNGGSLTAGAAIPTSLLIPGAEFASSVKIEGVDLSLLTGTGKALVDVTNINSGKIIFANCKLGAVITIKNGSWKSPGPEIWLHNCDSADTNYRFAMSCYAGDAVTETIVVKTGGSSDGATPYSFKMSTSANAEYLTIPLVLDIPPVWNSAVGSAKTATIEIVHDTNVAAGQGAGTAYAFQDDEIHLEIQYLGTSGFPKSTFGSDAPATVITAAADQDSSSVAWTTTGLTTPVKQKLSVTFTPQEAGFIQARIHFEKASKIVYVDGDLVIT